MIDASKRVHYSYGLILYSTKDFVISSCSIYQNPVIYLVGTSEAMFPKQCLQVLLSPPMDEWILALSPKSMTFWLDESLTY